MDEKFYYNVNKNTIEYGDEKFIAYVNCVDGFRIANKLNTFLLENIELKETNQELFDELQNKTSWLSLRGGELAILKKENEELRKENEDCKMMIATLRNIILEKEEE